MKMKILIAVIVLCSVLLCACRGGTRVVIESATTTAVDPNSLATHSTTMEQTTVTTTAEGESTTVQPTTTPSPDNTTTTTTTKPASTTTKKPTTTTTAPVTVTLPPIDNNNYFYNDNNFFETSNEVVIRPRLIYYSGNRLIAQCFVINGTDKTIYDINVNELSFSDTKGYFAKDSFGKLVRADGSVLELEPHSYVLWVFSFTGGVMRWGINLDTSLTYGSNIGYSW